MKYIRDKDQNIQNLDKKLNRANTGRPTINTPKRSSSKANNDRGNVRIEDRLMGMTDKKKSNIERLKRDLTPKFSPNINRKSSKLLKNISRNNFNDKGLLTASDINKGQFSTFDKSRNKNDQNSNGETYVTADNISQINSQFSKLLIVNALDFYTLRDSQNQNLKDFIDTYDQNLSNETLGTY